MGSSPTIRIEQKSVSGLSEDLKSLGYFTKKQIQRNAGRVYTADVSLYLLLCLCFVNMDINDVALNINAARRAGHIRLGFWLNKKSNKTPEEKAAARKTFGKPWFQWLQAIKSRKTGKIE